MRKGRVDTLECNIHITLELCGGLYSRNQLLDTGCYPAKRRDCPTLITVKARRSHQRAQQRRSNVSCSLTNARSSVGAMFHVQRPTRTAASEEINNSTHQRSHPSHPYTSKLKARRSHQRAQQHRSNVSCSLTNTLRGLYTQLDLFIYLPTILTILALLTDTAKSTNTSSHRGMLPAVFPTTQ